MCLCILSAGINQSVCVESTHCQQWSPSPNLEPFINTHTQTCTHAHFQRSRGEGGWGFVWILRRMKVVSVCVCVAHGRNLALEYKEFMYVSCSSWVFLNVYFFFSQFTKLDSQRSNRILQLFIIYLNTLSSVPNKCAEFYSFLTYGCTRCKGGREGKKMKRASESEIIYIRSHCFKKT